MKQSDISLSTNIPDYRDDSISLCGILGNDILQHFKVFEYKDVCNGKMLILSNGYIPVGSVSALIAQLGDIIPNDTLKTNLSQHSNCNACLPLENKFSVLNEIDSSVNTQHNFKEPNCKEIRYKRSPKHMPKVDNALAANQCKYNLSNVKNLNVNTNDVPVNKVVTSKKDIELQSCVNFVLEPKLTYYSPMRDIFEGSTIDHGLENLFNLESIGIGKENCSSYDIHEINKFKESIRLVDGQYHVDIPWHQDLLAKVPSNFKLAKTLALKVSEKNGSMDDDYFKVFEEQLNLGIIERLPASFDLVHHIFIPHRPVIRNDDLVKNSKIRPVFNCSLKVGKALSLNEAAYSGTVMLNEVLGLLLYFRTNNCVALADIAKAFLNIRLNIDSDKNCFSLVVFHRGKFHYFRYRSIVFGFISSPFLTSLLTIMLRVVKTKL